MAETAVNIQRSAQEAQTIVPLEPGSFYTIGDTRVSLVYSGKYMVESPGGMNGRPNITEVQGDFAMGVDQFVDGSAIRTIYTFKQR